MDADVLREMIQVIRREKQRLSGLELERRDADPDYSGEDWATDAVPFINELCLALLVALWHQVDRDLIHLAVRALSNGSEMSLDEYHEGVRRIEGRKKKNEFLEKQLNLPDCEGYEAMKALRLLANSYKHNPTMRPNAELLTQLGISVKCAPLPGSHCLRKGLAKAVGLDEESDYCAIADAFLNIAKRYLEQVQGRNQATLRRVKGIHRFRRLREC